MHIQRVAKLLEHLPPCLSVSHLGALQEDPRLLVMDDLRAADVDFLTVGQYLRPTPNHARVERYVPPEEFEEISEEARARGDGVGHGGAVDLSDGEEAEGAAAGRGTTSSAGTGTTAPAKTGAVASAPASVLGLVVSVQLNLSARELTGTEKGGEHHEQHQESHELLHGGSRRSEFLFGGV
mgnify:CR=1 FL=1